MNYFFSKKDLHNFKTIHFVLKCMIGIYIIGFLLKLFDGYFEVCSLIFLISILIYKSPEIIYNLKNKQNNFTQEQLKLILAGFSPRQFELFTYELFKGLGYNAHVMPDGPDGGKDVILNGKIYVECKRYNSDTVGREICQKLLGAVVADKMERGIIFTNGKIHNNALEFIKKTDKIELWDYDKIYEYATSLKKNKLGKIIDLVANNLDS